jgi:AcrR family transcriptional regulator
VAVAASDAPQRTPGTRSRSGNAMHRTRAALLDAAAHCVERYGLRKATMGDIALKAAVAKATLYNHFRTKDDVLAALVDTRVAALAARCEDVAAGRPLPAGEPVLGIGLAAALQCAAAAIAADRPLRRTVADEPAVAAALATPGEGRSWDAVRAHVARVLEAAGAPADASAVDVVLRWLVSQVLVPVAPAVAAHTAVVLERGLRAPAADSVAAEGGA